MRVRRASASAGERREERGERREERGERRRPRIRPTEKQVKPQAFARGRFRTVGERSKGRLGQHQQAQAQAQEEPCCNTADYKRPPD